MAEDNRYIKDIAIQVTFKSTAIKIINLFK